MTSSAALPQDGACKSGADYCQPPNKCVNGECAIPAPPPPAPKPMPTQRRIPTYIPAGGTCIVGGTPCITGYSCVEGKCAIPYVIPTYIPAGGTCIVGGTPCITGYSCVNAICVIGQSVPMPTCGVSLISSFNFQSSLLFSYWSVRTISPTISALLTATATITIVEDGKS